MSDAHCWSVHKTGNGIVAMIVSRKTAELVASSLEVIYPDQEEDERVARKLALQIQHNRSSSAYPLWDVVCTLYDLMASRPTRNARTSQVINALLGSATALGIAGQPLSTWQANRLVR